jgi:hypothetical protein
MYGGGDNQASKFVRRGYWKLGWEDDEQPNMAKRRDQIKPNDRIAIKRMMGRGASDIRITALGVVTETDLEDGREYVRWIADDLDRVVDARGCFGTIHGPFVEGDDWVKEIFWL